MLFPIRTKAANGMQQLCMRRVCVIVCDAAVGVAAAAVLVYDRTVVPMRSQTPTDTTTVNGFPPTAHQDPPASFRYIGYVVSKTNARSLHCACECVINIYILYAWWGRSICHHAIILSPTPSASTTEREKPIIYLPFYWLWKCNRISCRVLKSRAHIIARQ